MKLKTKYITPDDFKNYFGIDLDAQLENSAAEPFLKRVEDIVANYLDARYFRKVDAAYREFSDYQKEHYKLALLEQAYYMFRNGDISSDSGYDPESGEKLSRARVIELTLAPNAKDNLMVCGLLTRKIGGRVTWL